MRLNRKVFWLLVIVLGMFAQLSVALAASSDNPRLRTRVQERKIYHWYLARWADNQVVCDIYLAREGQPTLQDVGKSCGQSIMLQWQRTPACTTASSGCRGLYLVFGGEYQVMETVNIVLDPPDMWLSLPGCEARGDGYYYCEEPPVLRLEAYEPVAGATIERIEARLGNVPYACEGDVCEILLRQTGPDGVDLRFWAQSSLGDTSEAYQALLRVRAENPALEARGPWYVTLVSDRLLEQSAAACAVTWQAMPPEDGLPAWLQTPATFTALATNEPYTYLAGQLIAAGVVDANACANGGLLPNGAATPCGLEAARAQVEAQQNHFDETIWLAARQANIPPMTLKRLLAQESQFWPNRVGEAGESGLGQMSLVGADALLLWSPEFFAAFCPDYLFPWRCANGYVALTAAEQSLLRGAVMAAADVTCPECAEDWDVTRAKESIEIFAYALQASCRQVNQVWQNVAHQPPGWGTSYEDLWRFTLANYNAGSGCLTSALQEARAQNLPLSWQAVAPLLDQECPGVQDYVEGITRQD